MFANTLSITSDISGDVFAVVQEILTTLRSSKIVPKSAAGKWGRFWTVYKQEADEYDLEFLRKYREEMNACMVFVSFLRRTRAHSPRLTLLALSLLFSLPFPLPWRA